MNTRLIALIFATALLKVQGAPGVDSIVASKAIFVEGKVHRVAYAPGSSQLLNFEGSWHAIISERGIQISTTLDGVQRDVTIIGNDLFVLESRAGGFQAGQIRPITNNVIFGDDMILSQYIMERVTEKNHLARDESPGYAKSWFLLQSALAADPDEGVSCLRHAADDLIEDKWYVNRHIVNGASMPIVAYPTNGFLAITYTSRTGDFIPGETVSIKEYWPKTKPDSSEDVYPFRDTKLSVSNIKQVAEVNLLPTISSPKARLEDFRFLYATNGLPLNLPLKSALWVPKNSRSWPEYLKIAHVKLRAKPDYIVVTTRGNLKMRLFIMFIMFFLTVPLVIFIFRSGICKTNKQQKTKNNKK